MKERWFEFIEFKDREAQYLQTLVLATAANVDKYQKGHEKLKTHLLEYYGALFPWLEDPSIAERKRNLAIIKQMEVEIDHLEKTHVFEARKEGDTISIVLPSYMIGGKSG